MPDRITLISVAVAKPSVLGHNRDGEVLSGIRKRQVVTPTVVVRQTNIDGDGQADLVNHGGIDKAVYCYPREHREIWSQEIGYDRSESPFGENLSTLGITEEDVCIGDLWSWGSAVLQVSQPRWPCYKLAMHADRMDMVKRFVAAGRSGWYLRVIEEGEAPTSGEITIVERDPRRISVVMAFVENRNKDNPELRQRLNDHPYLSNDWKT